MAYFALPLLGLINADKNNHLICLYFFVLRFEGFEVQSYQCTMFVNLNHRGFVEKSDLMVREPRLKMLWMATVQTALAASALRFGARGSAVGERCREPFPVTRGKLWNLWNFVDSLGKLCLWHWNLFTLKVFPYRNDTEPLFWGWKGKEVEDCPPTN